jgi:hypothetical protein
MSIGDLELRTIVEMMKIHKEVGACEEIYLYEFNVSKFQ